MTVNEIVLKNGFCSTNWQILEFCSLIPFEFRELFNGKTWDLIKNKKLLNLPVIGYYRELNHGRYILMVKEVQK